MYTVLSDRNKDLRQLLLPDDGYICGKISNEYRYSIQISAETDRRLSDMIVTRKTDVSELVRMMAELVIKIAKKEDSNR